MERPYFEAGTPAWVDLGSSDPAGAKHFYGGLFGWVAEEQGGDPNGYAIFHLRDFAVAGVGPLSRQGQASAWMTYISVDDADETAAKVKAAGGRVFVGPMDAIEAGRFAVVGDTSGATFGLWQPKSHEGADIVGEPGSMCWHELNTRYTIVAASFYGAVFGWEAQEIPIDQHVSYTEWLVGDKSVCGMMPISDTAQGIVSPQWLVHFAVADCDQSFALAKSLGASAYVEPTDVPPGRLAVLADPQGALFAVIQLIGER
jgi:predicted enzyme related to lactoylglutathione lyase